MKAVVFLFAFFLFLHFASPVLAANLLSNPGFESGITNWSKYGGDINASSSTINSGTASATLTSTTSSTKWIYQVASVTGGVYYSFSGYAVKNDSNISSILLRISWYSSTDGSGSELSHNDSTSTLTDNNSSYQSLSTGAFAAPDDANSARAKAVVAFTSTNQTIAYFDDFVFQETTAPTSTPTPTPTTAPTSTPTPTLTPTPTSSPTNTPTPTPTKTPTPTSATNAPTSKPVAPPTQENALQDSSSVLGESTGTKKGLDIAPPDNLISDAAKKPDNIFQGFLIILGIVLIAISIMFTLRIIKKGEQIQNEEE